jgi:hypothetical protein
MAEQNPNSIGTRRFDKGLNEDINDYHLPENEWTHARNAINNSRTGDIGKLGNEPSNKDCLVKSIKRPYTIIGTLHVIADKWLIYSTNDTNSEIGVFQESKCGLEDAYTVLVNDDCLNFNRLNLIKGVVRPTSTCTYIAYWDDGNNPSRKLEFDVENLNVNDYTNPNSPIPWIQSCIDSNGLSPGGCIICTNTSLLDCDKIRLARFVDKPCVTINKGVSAGTLLNGSYLVAVAYSIDSVKVSDWYVSNVQPLFQHLNNACSLDVNLSNLDKSFQEIQVAIIYVVSNQTVVRLAGTYSTNTQRISFDTIDNTWPTVPIENIPINTPIVDKTDGMYAVGDYLIRVGPTSKFDFNYQPIANQIVTKWQSVEYPIDYYRKGGNNTGYMRDEVYPFFIRWVFDTGERTQTFHIPGRPSFPSDLVTNNSDAIGDEVTAGLNKQWYVENTATIIPSVPSNLSDGGVVIAEGYMGYWESSEFYPDDKPQVWNAATNPLGGGFNATIPEYPGTNLAELDLCGRPIRHHKLPDLYTASETEYYNSLNNKIRIIGVKFENVNVPLMNDGITPVKGIVGYEILRGARNGNKSIIAKGLISNMGLYNLQDGSNQQGAYVNYPYNDLRTDPFLTDTQIDGSSCSIIGQLSGSGSVNPLGTFSRNLVSFHSPDTTFTDPFLSAKEMKIHGEMNGGILGKFEYSEEHPKEKLITNFTFIIAAVGGIGLAAIAQNGKKSVKYAEPINPGHSATVVGPTTGTSPSVQDIIALPVVQAALLAAAVTKEASSDTGAIFAQSILGFLNTEGVGKNTEYLAWQTAYNAALLGLGFGSQTPRREETYEDGESSNIPQLLRIATGIPLFVNNFTRAADEIINLFKAVIRYRDFALRYHSHCFYNKYKSVVTGSRRYEIQDAQYIGPQMANFSPSVRVNNLMRANTVAIQVNPNKPIIDPTVNDVSRIPVSVVNDLREKEFPISPTANTIKSPEKLTFGPASSYAGPDPAIGWQGAGNAGVQVGSSNYVSLKQRIRNQYGQLQGITIVPASTCTFSGPESGVVFGGDTYVGRYTEKNTFFYFYNWLFGQPDGAQLNYKTLTNIPYPRFFANFEQFETGDFVQSIGSFFSAFPGAVVNALTNLSNAQTALQAPFQALVVPSDFYNLDGGNCTGSWISIDAIRFAVRYQYFYLFNSGVKDFFVESELNVDLRDWGDLIAQQHYDPYRFTDTKELFNTRIIKDVNYYKYDQSLSIAKLFLNYASWGSMQLRNYDPFIAETCFTYNPTRAIYSLPSQFESIHDSWTNFLPNNYYDFNTRVTCIKPINKNGALIFFEGQSPAQFFGTDQLQTTGGTKLTIGDGGLFDQPLQNIVNADAPYEYASCQDRLSVINTPAGIYWISQNQNKIFAYGGGLNEVSMMDMKWWLISYLPYKLLKQFPNFEVTENPVVGIGSQSIYDNQNGLLYFSKRDFMLRTDLSPEITLVYIGGVQFEVQLNGQSRFTVELGDPRYFEDASWTISYDPKVKQWVSYHDWHPNLMMPGKNTFLTTKNDGIWLHNYRTDNYCNYYGIDYPFEVEYMVNTAQSVDTLRSIQYQLECYKYAANSFDRFHVLDFNFDEAVIYNTEQVSGLLKLVPNPKQDPFAIIQYPKVNFNNIEIISSKQENNYRFNQFWDITDDRGEYNPNAQRVIWNTGANGYVRTLNPNNLNYAKDEFQRKKFRHYLNYVFLRRNVCNDRKMLILFTNNKELNSPR